MSTSRPLVFYAVLFALSSIIFFAAYWIFVHTPEGQLLENSVLGVTLATQQSWLVLGLISEENLLIAGIVIGLLGMARGKYRTTFRALAFLAVVNVAGQLLKRYFLNRPVLDLDLMIPAHINNSFPSGHIIAFFSVMVALAMVLPLRGYLITLLLAVVVQNIATYDILQFGVHRLSDVIGSFMLSLGGLAVVLLLFPSDRESPDAYAGPHAGRAGSVLLATLLWLAPLAVTAWSVFQLQPVTEPEVLLVVWLGVGSLLVSIALWLTHRAVRPQFN